MGESIWAQSPVHIDDPYNCEPNKLLWLYTLTSEVVCGTAKAQTVREPLSCHITGLITGSIWLDCEATFGAIPLFPNIFTYTVALSCVGGGITHCSLRPGTESSLFYLLVVWPWASHFPLSELYFLVYNNEKKKVSLTNISCGCLCNIHFWFLTEPWFHSGIHILSTSFSALST